MSGDLDSLQAAAAAALRPAGGGVTRESVGRFMNRVGEYFLALLDDLAPMPHHQRQEIEERVGALFLKDFFLDADYRTLVDNLLPLVRRNREPEALERLALVEALAAVAFLHTILPRGGEADPSTRAGARAAPSPVERLTFHALDRFFRVTLNSTREVVRSRLMANVEYQDLFGDDGLAELVDRRWRLAFDEVRAALVSRTAVSEQRLADLLTVGTLSRTPARTFNQQYARLWEIVTVRVHGFPIPVVRRGVAPETLTGTPASPRGTQAMLLRWGHTQLTFVWHGDRLAAGNVALVNRLIPGTEAGRPVLRFDNCLVKRNGTLELLELAAPARVDYLFLHGLHPDLISGAHEATGVPMPWGAVLQKVTYAKAVYHEVYAGTPVRFPRQVCWLVAQTKGRDPDLVKQEILHRVIDFLARHPDIAGLVVKPGGESGGRGVRPFPKEALDAIVEWGYQISRSDDA
ncbi:MAG: hypothetical protein HY719_10850, partial [Planctomycetes bacterium]|nr:hypothetical protein [Planctomycetota bacterium]